MPSTLLKYWKWLATGGRRWLAETNDSKYQFRNCSFCNLIINSDNNYYYLQEGKIKFSGMPLKTYRVKNYTVGAVSDIAVVIF